MQRMLLPLAALTVALVLPTRALAAEECVCGVAEANPYSTWGIEVATDVAESDETVESVDPALLMDHALDPADLETPDPHAVRAVAPSPGRRRAPVVMWCVHSNDPRCSPLAPEDDPTPRSLPEVAPMIAPSTARMRGPRLVRFELTTSTPAPVEDRDTSDPHVSRLERPPRR